MADQKLTDRTAITTSTDNALLHVVDLGGSYKQTKANLLKEDRARISDLETTQASNISRIENVEENQYSGVVVYETLAELPVTGVLLTSYKVTNDGTSSNNGYYHWNGSIYVKDADLANGIVEIGNTDAVSGETVYSSNQALKSNVFEFTSTEILREDVSIGNYLTNTGSFGGFGDYYVNKYAVKEGFKYKILASITAQSTSFAAYGFYSSIDVSSYVSGIEVMETGVNTYDLIITIPAGVAYLFVTQDGVSDTVNIYEELSTSSLVENENKPNNLHSNYQLEASIGLTPLDADTSTPINHLISLSNSTYSGYQTSDCPTKYPSMEFNMGTDPLISSYILNGIEITDTNTLRKIKGKSVVFSYYVKHDTALDAIYLNRLQGDVTDFDYTLKHQNNLIGTWYKISYTFTVTSNDIDLLYLSSYPIAPIGANVNIELSSFSLKLESEESSVNYLFSENSRWESIRNQIINNDAYLSLPNEIVAVEGNRLEIFKHSIIKAINPDNYFLSASVISGTPKGYFYDRVYIYDCVSSDTDFVIEFTLSDNNLNILDKKEVTIKPILKALNPLSTFNILLIGDSFTATTTYPSELYRRLFNTGGTPVADGLTNVEFIGTNDLGTVPREGWSGESWSFFLGSSSPFWNTGTAQIDFANYCTVNSYTGIDGVVILLGTNETSSNTVISSLLDELIAFNPSIKGVVTGKIFPTPFGGAGAVGISTSQFYYNQLKNSLDYNRRVESLISATYSFNFRFIDILPSFDIMNNMQFSELGANYRNQSTLVKQGTDNVHPATSGYLQIADIIYGGVHKFIL